MPRIPLTRRRPHGDERRERAPRSAAWPVRTAAWAVEEKVVWVGADAARAAADGARYPFERLAWTVERRILWPLQDATAGWSRSARLAAAAGLAAAALAAGTAGAITASPSGTAPDPAPEPSPVEVTAPVPTAASAPTPAAAAVAEGPVLQGATPTFEAATEPKAAAAEENALAASDQAAKRTAAEPVPGQKEAIRVAERFAEAFVLYEIGEESAEVRRTFAETASPDLAKALGERPPRQPAGVEVPKARVLNVVPGPSHGDRLTVSASLLRVGSTSELRLDMRRTDDGWRITDVRG
ncbi:MAG TPA: hypothetical protein VKA89_10515 [Solirubrobacterales bacterium]|nr:hypothetical protein [Solirubrobacterales bacterium]